MGEKGGAVGLVQADDMGDGMQCMDHPYRSNPGGICAFCLQEKLGKLVTSSKLTGPFFPLQPPLSASSSSSPAAAPADAAGAGDGPARGILTSASSRTGNGRTRIPILSFSGHRKKKIGSTTGGGGTSGNSRKVATSAVAACTPPSLLTAPAAAGNNAAVVLKRSKSVASRPVEGRVDGGASAGAESLAMDSPRKKSFWSFLYLSTSSASTATSSLTSNNNCNNNRRKSTSSSSGGGGDGNKRQHNASTDEKDGDFKTAAPRKSEHAAGEAVESPMTRNHAASSFGRKVERSRSVGCGSRSFSGDFLERISTGFGDCTLRRVESHRESKPKMSLRLNHGGDQDDDEQQRHRMKERIKCGGLFGGFGMALASSFWLSAAVDDDFDNSSRISSATPRAMAVVGGGGHNAAGTPHGRARYWGWAFASPMRAFRPTVASKYLYTVKSHANASAAATNAISAINASNNVLEIEVSTEREST